MRKQLKILIFILLISVIIGVGIYFSSRREEAQPEPEYVTFPFSWTEEARGIAIEITVVNITYLGNGTLEKIGLRGVEADEGYQFYGVYVAFKNLGHEHFYFHGTGISAYLELKTDRENIYRPSWGTTNPIRLYDLRPEEKDGTWSVFEIRNDEKPIELRNYKAFNGELYIAYIWKLNKI